jgi:hypothetical protein
MSIFIEIDDWTKVEIDQWTSEKGNVFMTLRQLKRGKNTDKYFPQKTKSGGFSALALRVEHWVKVAPRLIEYLRFMGVETDEELNRMMAGQNAPELFCSECGEEIRGGKVLCSDCLIKLAEREEERDDEF